MNKQLIFPDTLEVTVGPEDYKNSSKHFIDINNCPLATAFRRVLDIPKEVQVSASPMSVRFVNKNEGPKYYTDNIDNNIFGSDEYFDLEMRGASKTLFLTKES